MAGEARKSAQERPGRQEHPGRQERPMRDVDADGVFHVEQGLTPANLKTGGTLGYMVLTFSVLAVVLGLFWLMVGTFKVLGYTPVWERPSLLSPGVRIVDGIGYLIFGLIFAGGGLGALLWRSEVTIDPNRKIWHLCQGLFPFLHRQSGTYDDLKGVLVRAETRHGRTYHWLYLVWHQGQKPVRLRHTAFQTRMAEFVAREYADRLSLPLEYQDEGT